MDEHIYKSHNKTLLLYHLVFPAKYRKEVFDDEIDKTLRDICLKISDRYEINFIEIGNDKDHVHFLVQSVPTLSITQIVTKIKSITAREIFKAYPLLKKAMWGASLWTSGYYANTVGLYASRDTITQYIKNQGHSPNTYSKIHQGKLRLDS